MKPPFSYYGGKQRILTKIIPYIPQHTVYCEPFCGGATLLFQKPDLRTGNNDDYREAINDINSDIYNFFTVLRDNFDELNHLVSHSIYSQEEHKKSKEFKGGDPVLRAYFFYINISMSYAKKLSGAWGTSVFSENHPLSYINQTKRLKECADRIRGCYISNEDALKFIDRWDSPQTFFYCDPPYPDTNQGHYRGYTQSNFDSLLQKLDKCKGSFILSCYNNDAVPKGWKKVEFETVTSASNTKKGGHRNKRTECIWIREAMERPRKEVLKIYERQKELSLFDRDVATNWKLDTANLP